MEKIKLTRYSFVRQLLCASCLCLLACQMGVVFEWPTIAIDYYRQLSDITYFESRFLGMLSYIGAMVATPICGYVSHKIGRKYSSLLFGLSFVLTWLITYLTRSAVWSLVAMAISGIGVAGQYISLIFISEVCHESIRGGMIALSASGYFFGKLLNSFLKQYWFTLLITSLTMAIIAELLLMLLPESPVYLVMVGKIEEAKKSLAFYNYEDPLSDIVQNEIKRINMQLDPRLEKLESDTNAEAYTLTPLTNEADDVMESNNESNNESAWRILRKSKSTQKALLVILGIITFAVLKGEFVIEARYRYVFEDALPFFSSSESSALLAGDSLFASIVCALVIKYGSKNFLIASFLGSGIFILLLAALEHSLIMDGWKPAVIIFGYRFVHALGCSVIPFVLMTEVFLPKVRCLCISIVMTFYWVILFASFVVYYVLLSYLIRFTHLLYEFSLMSFFGAVFCMLTKSKI